MKIMIVGYSTSVGGAEKRMISFANYCVQCNDVKLVTFKSGNINFSNLIDERVEHVNLESNINLHSIIRLYKHIKCYAPDKVYGFLGHVNVVLGFLKTLFPNIIFLGRENATYSEYFSEKGKKGKLLKILYRIFTKKLDIIVAQSNYMKEELIRILKIPKEKIHLITNPLPEKLDLKKESFVFDPDIKYLLSVGRLDSVKNQIDMIKVLDSLPTEYELIFVGEGELYNRLNKYSLSLKLDKRVHFLGYTENTAYYYTNSNLLLLTSLRETSPNVILEATTYGLFSITYNIPGGIKDLIEQDNNGIVITNNTLKCLAEEIQKNINKKVKYTPEKFIDEYAYNKKILNLGD